MCMCRGGGGEVLEYKFIIFRRLLLRRIGNKRIYMSCLRRVCLSNLFIFFYKMI